MQIQETITRECCTPEDLQQYHGETCNHTKSTWYRFCKYCGQVWLRETFGDSEVSLTKVYPSTDKGSA